MNFTTSLDPNNYFRWCAIKDRQIIGGIVRSEDSYKRLLANLTSWNIYLGLNPANTWRGIKVSDAQISEVIGLVIDLDPRLPNPSPPSEAVGNALMLTIEEVMGRLPSTTLLNTGRGLQAWLRVQPTPLTGLSDRQQWRFATKDFLRQMAYHFPYPYRDLFTIDTSCSDLSRLVRAPGSINQKTGRLVTTMAIFEYPAIEPASFLGRFTSTISESSIAPLHPTDKWWKSFHLLSHKAQMFLTEGITEPGRHAAAYATAASLRDIGASQSLSEHLILESAKLCSPPLSSGDALRACRNAYGSLHATTSR